MMERRTRAERVAPVPDGRTPRDQCIAPEGAGTVRAVAAGALYDFEWLRAPVHALQVSGGCDRRCAWCRGCRTEWGTPPDPADADPAVLEGSARVRFEGGNPLLHAALEPWFAWVRAHSALPIEVQAPASTVGDPAVVARIAALAPQAVVLELPTGDAAQHLALTGAPLDLDAMLAGAAALRAAGVAVLWLIPVNEATAPTLAATVLALAERGGPDARVALQRAPLLERMQPIASALWSELDTLSAQLASLPETLPSGARLAPASNTAYPPCVLDSAAQRPDLFPTARLRRAPADYPAAACHTCAAATYCEWTPGETAAPVDRMRPIGPDTAAPLLDHAERHRRDLRGAPSVHTAKVELPSLVCYAPFTSLAVLSLRGSPVPCAQSWVQSELPLRVRRRESGLGYVEYLRREVDSRRRFGVPAFDAANEDWSLQEAWNAPLLRKMRREMRPRGPTSHCRDMCRVLLGVEPRRGEDLLRRPVDQLTPACHDNRMHVVDELMRGVEEMTANPLLLCIGVASRCNISCGFCTGPLGTHGELTDRRYEEVVKFLPTLMSLSVVGPGEPLMSKNFGRLLEHIEANDYRSLQLSLTTNGTLLSPAWFRRLGRVRFSSLRISINAGSAAVHESIIGKAVWDRLMESIEYLGVRHRDPADPLQLTLSCVLGGKVMGDLGNFAELVDRTGCHIVLEPMTGDLDGTSPFTTAERTHRLAAECAEVAARFKARNPEIHRAFAAMATYTAERGRTERFDRLPQR